MKYLVRSATAGSEQKKKLLDAQRAFEKVWRKAEKNTGQEDGVR